MLILGIDPGLTGGLAVLDCSGPSPKLLDAIDVPVAGDKAKRRVHVAAVLRFCQHWVIKHAFIERAQAMPDQGSSSGFIYGRAVGALEACVEGMQIPLTVIEPTAWKKTHGLRGRAKEDSRQRAIRLFPGHPAFDRRMDHGRAEAALIAWHGAQVLGLIRSVDFNNPLTLRLDDA